MFAPAPLIGQLETTDEIGRRLRVEFWRLGDRYAHRVVFLDAEGQRTTLLESAEGDALSPALQAMNLDDLDPPDHRSPITPPPSRPAMLVGMVGKSHWSVSIDPTAEPNEGAVLSLAYESACRMKAIGGSLHATFTAPDAWPLSQTERQLVFRTHGIDWRVLCLPPSDDRHAPCRASFTKPNAVMACEPPLDLTAPLTLQWRFAVEVLG
jgi:hypothetical protein